MATMGFSPAAAIGAKLGAPSRKVIGLVGDGGLTSVLGSLATAVEHGYSIKLINEDDDLAALRALPEVEALLRSPQPSRQP